MTHVFVVAGEASGDALGAELVEELKVRLPGLRCSGVGGALLLGAGQRQCASVEEMSVMGASGVVRALPRLVRLRNRIFREIKRQQPDAVITIDNQEFSLSLGKKLKRLGIPLVHYVCPSVWAWRRHRAKRYCRTFDLMLALLPFEPMYFNAGGRGKTIFVGHGAVARARANVGEVEGEEGVRSEFGVAAEAKVILVLPGSRVGELEANLPEMVRALVLLKARGEGGLHLLAPVAPRFAARTERALCESGLPCTVVSGDGDKWKAFHVADAALATSGTVVAELAAVRVPYVAVYKLAGLNRVLLGLHKASPRIAAAGATLPNLSLARRAFPEHIGAKLKPEAIAADLQKILGDAAHREAMQDDLEESARRLLKPDNPNPAAAAADAVVALLGAAQAVGSTTRP